MKEPTTNDRRNQPTSAVNGLTKSFLVKKRKRRKRLHGHGSKKSMLSKLASQGKLQRCRQGRKQKRRNHQRRKSR
ncbi:hypothetical protein ANCCAN_01448 [Ancylostoma caninum]|uniref:Uncharacterized protein n=1 Tax=Ancylostoma caninum TaxID=29170 RepID=A0A368HAX8_ANCCA|nr:hypothetical protein ANCCAN_01448 [Ancylostoma caninum]